MSTSLRIYSEEERLYLLREFHQSGQSKNAFCKSHGLSCVSLLNRWLNHYEIEKEMLPLHSEQSEEDMANRSKEDYKKEIADLKKRNRDLEKALEFSRLETLARDMMIDKAEDYFDISIRKNLGPSSNGAGLRARPEGCARCPAYGGSWFSTGTVDLIYGR